MNTIWSMITAFITAVFAIFFPVGNHIVEPPVSTQSVAQQLQDCLPKSDMASKAKCDQLLLTIQTFDGCVEAGFAVQESYPERCLLPDGRSFTKQYPSTSPTQNNQATTLTGTYECLPHKNTEGPQTMECALGLFGTDGYHYALDLTALHSGGMINFATGTTLEVDGMLVPIEQISSNHWQKYNIRGIIKVTNLSQIK